MQHLLTYFDTALRPYKRSKTCREDVIFLRLKDQRLYLAVTDSKPLLDTKIRQKGPSPVHHRTNVKPLFSWIEDLALPLNLGEWNDCLHVYRRRSKILVYQKKRYARHRIQQAQTGLESWVREEGLRLHRVSDYYPLDRQCSACGSLNPQSEKQYPNFQCVCGYTTTATLNYFSMLWGAMRYELQMKNDHEDRPRFRAVS